MTVMEKIEFMMKRIAPVSRDISEEVWLRQELNILKYFVSLVDEEAMEVALDRYYASIMKEEG